MIFDSNELIGKRIATLVSPYLGAILLNQQFSNPIQQPVFSSVDNTEAAVDMIKQGKATAAIIPTPMVSSFEGLNVVETTSQYPLITVIAAPSVPEAMIEKLHQALIQAKNNAAGQAVLKAINIPAGFIDFKSEDVKGLDSLLHGTYGY